MRHEENCRSFHPDWVRESRATHSETGPDSDYGYMWWNGVRGGLLPNVRVREHSFFASGYRGHRVIVLPYRNLVIVHRVDTDSGNVNIGGRESGPLLWLILDAAGETDIGDTPHLEIAQGIRVTAENPHETWGESTIWYFDGPEEQYITSHAPDSTMTFTARESGELVDTGKWWAGGGKVCRQWKELEGGEKACFYVALDDTTLQWFDLNGTLAGKVDFFRK